MAGGGGVDGSAETGSSSLGGLSSGSAPRAPVGHASKRATAPIHLLDLGRLFMSM
jgi:hypothetical protein